MNEPVLSYHAILPALVAIIQANLRSQEVVTSQTPLTGTGIDSLTMVRILIGVEDKFGIWIDGEYLIPENLRDVDALAACLEKLLSAAPSA